MLNTNFPPWPSFTPEEAKAVESALLSNRVNQWTGQEVWQFEKEFASHFGAQHAVALSNGTVALDLALMAIGVGQGDEVIVTPRTFIASVSSVVSVGATPVFCDVDIDTQNLCIRSIESCITTRTKAIIIVHLAGMPADMDAIMALANAHDIKVIEDCAQAHGAKWNGQSVGTFGHVGAWSFCQDKIMTTGGEGGMITTNCERIWKWVWSYKDHGKDYDAVFDASPAKGYRWLHQSFGTNARMTEIQATIGRIQLKRMEEWHKRRLSYALKIWNACESIPWIRVPPIDPRAEHAAYKCYVFLDQEQLPEGWNRERIIDSLNAAGIPAYEGTCAEVYFEKAFDGTSFRPKSRLPNAKRLGESSLMFLVHPTLNSEHIDATVAALKSIDTEIQATIDSTEKAMA